jgi:hypothetical protein
VLCFVGGEGGKKFLEGGCLYGFRIGRGGA